jgi:hypothetical protein
MSDPERFIGAAGEVVLSYNRNVIEVSLSGQIDLTITDGVEPALNRLLVQKTGWHVFFDAEHMVDYVTAFRVRMTEVIRRNRSQIAGVHALVRSKIARMGLSVANLALGGFITGHGTRETFIAARDKVS